MQLDTVARTSDELAVTTARGAKVARLSALLGQTEDAAEASVVVSWLSGELTQRQIGVGWASLRTLPPPAAEPNLTVAAVEASFQAIGGVAGAGAQSQRRALLDELFRAAIEREQAFLRRLLIGDLRQGALAGVMADAVARAAGIPLAEVRRAAMLRGDLSVVAAAALHDGAQSLADFGLRVGQPIGPMLAQTAGGTGEALETLGGRAAFEWKVDGVRVQVHRCGDEVRIFTRTLDEVTSRLPEVVAAVRSLDTQALVADGEVIALAPDGRPRPFQVTAGRLGSRRGTDQGPAAVTLSLFLFDLLHLDGRDLLDEPGEVRAGALSALIETSDSVQTIPRLVTDDPILASGFFEDALAHGHEGVMAKSLEAGYAAGRRGAGWLKIKPVHTLDLVVLAAEWGSGRRQGKLSNIHLGARAETTGEFVMLGKTFKGMTDEMLRWQTERFLSLAAGPTDEWMVPLRPEQVVEIAFDGVQNSSRYPGGVALRFARVLRYRDDKSAAEADVLDTVLSFHDG